MQSGRVSSNRLETGSKLNKINNNKQNVIKFLREQTPLPKAPANKAKTTLETKKHKFKL